MRVPVFRSSSPMQNRCSSSPFFLSLSKNYSKTMMKITCKMGVHSVLYMSRYMANIKTKQSKNRRKSKRHVKETGNRGNNRPPRPWAPPRPGRGSHWLWWLLGSPPPRFGLSVLRLGPQVFAFLGVFWASSCYHLLILMALTSLAWIHVKHFSQNLGLNHRNLQYTFNKPKSSIMEENMHKLQINAN